MTIGEQIREWRHKAGKGATEVAAAVGVSSATLGAWERGNGQPKAGQTLDLLKVLDVSEGDWMSALQAHGEAA